MCSRPYSRYCLWLSLRLCWWDSKESIAGRNMALGGLINVEAVQVSRGDVEHRFRTGCKNTSLDASGSVFGMELDVGGKVVLCRRLINIARRWLRGMSPIPQWDVCMHSFHWDRQRLWIRRRYNSTASTCNSADRGTHLEKCPYINRGRKRSDRGGESLLSLNN